MTSEKNQRRKKKRNDQFPMLLNVPKKLRALFEKINDFRYFLLDGGRGSGKSQTVARVILWICEQRKVRVMCLREIQNSIEESVYQLLVDIITEFDLPWDIRKNQLTHRGTGSTIRFRGCREQGVDSLKSMEGYDIVWVEEAQSVTKTSLDTLIPTIRKDRSKIFFTMNRFLRKDPVFDFAATRKDCLHININYHENEFCPDVLKAEAAECKRKNEKDYRHIWKGEPLDTAVQYLFDFNKLGLVDKLEPFGDLFVNQSVMAVDFAGGGGDLCVASRLIRLSNVHWGLRDQVAWSDPDTNISIGKTINLYGQWIPDILIVDAGGMGYPMFIDLSKTIRNIIGFDGSKTDKVSPVAANNRAEAYLQTKDFVDQEWFICKSDLTIKQFETVKKVYQKNGKILIQSKKDAREKDNVDSPDRADSVAMAIFAIKHYLGKIDFASRDTPHGQRAIRVNVRKQLR